MTNKKLFVEKREETDDFAVRRAGSQRASAVADTQAEAIAIARALVPGAGVHVERVRHTSAGKPDQWRKV